MKLLRKIIGLGLAAFLALAPASATQDNLWSPTTGTVSGLALSNTYNNALTALASCNSGASAPANVVGGVPVTGQCWLDTSSSRLRVRVYDGASWPIVFEIDAATNITIPFVGGGAGTIASATTTDLGSVVQPYKTVTGTTTITGFGSSARTGTLHQLKFTGALLLTHNATSLILPNNSLNVTTVANDTALALYLGGGNWQVVAYQRADGTALNTSAVFTGAVSFTAQITPSALGGNTNDYNPTSLQTSAVIRISASSAVNLTGLTAPTSNAEGRQIILHNVGSFNITLPASNTSSAAANRFNFPAAIVLLPGQSLSIIYDNTTTNWRLNNPYVALPVAGGFKTLKLINGGTPDNQMTGTADGAALENASGAAIRRLSLSCTADITASGAGGLDTGARAANTWYSYWFIYNPTTNTDSCLFSLQATANGTFTAALPSGYTFFVRAGWVRNATTQLHRTLCYGRTCQYIVTAGSATTVPPVIATGTASVWTTLSISTFVPPTASRIGLILRGTQSDGTWASVAPNSAYTAANGGNAPLIVTGVTLSGPFTISGFIILESTNIVWAAGATSNLGCFGWEDNL